MEKESIKLENINNVTNLEVIFTTGQMAIDKNGNVLYPNDPIKQADYVFQRLQKILTQVGSSLNDIVKATIFITDMNGFKEISKVRNKYFKNPELSVHWSKLIN